MSRRESIAFGHRVYERRTAQRITIRALANAVGCSAQEVSDVEHGRLLSAQIAAWAARLWPHLACTVEWLRDGPAEEPKTLEERVVDLERRLEALTRDLVRRRY